MSGEGSPQSEFTCIAKALSQCSPSSFPSFSTPPPYFPSLPLSSTHCCFFLLLSRPCYRQQVLSMYVGISAVYTDTQKSHCVLAASIKPLSSQLHLTSSVHLGLRSTCDQKSRQIRVSKSQCPICLIEDAVFLISLNSTVSGCEAWSHCLALGWAWR